MMQAAGTMFTCMAAKLTPTASASMEVATASGNIALAEKSLSTSSSPPKLSRTMLAPMRAKRRKATQGPTRFSKS